MLLEEGKTQLIANSPSSLLICAILEGVNLGILQYCGKTCLVCCTGFINLWLEDFPLKLLIFLLQRSAVSVNHASPGGVTNVHTCLCCTCGHSEHKGLSDLLLNLSKIISSSLLKVMHGSNGLHSEICLFLSEAFDCLMTLLKGGSLILFVFGLIIWMNLLMVEQLSRPGLSF